MTLLFEVHFKRQYTPSTTVMDPSSNYYMTILSHSIKLHMFIEEFFDDGNAFAGEDGTENSADADPVKSVEDGEG